MALVGPSGTSPTEELQVLLRKRMKVVSVIGLCVAARQAEYVGATLAGAEGDGVCTVIGQARRCSATAAALINGMSSAVYSFDDTHAQALVHPGGLVASGLLALVQTRQHDTPARSSRHVVWVHLDLAIEHRQRFLIAAELAQHVRLVL